MNKDEALALLRGGQKTVKEWNERRKELPDPPSLRGADLGTGDLSYADLKGMDLREAVLGGADLSYADLSGAILSGGKLESAQLHLTIMQSALVHKAELASAYLSSADLRGSDLSGSDMSQATLSDANLGETNLRETDLRGADLGYADLRLGTLHRADLREADLGLADLSACDLCQADLRGASMEGTYLKGSHLSATKLAGARLIRARIGQTYFACDLSEAVGLDQTEHHGESSISMASVLSFRGPMAETFLRNCGLREEELEYFRAQTETPTRTLSCLISHVDEDKGFALKLLEALQARGVRCWLDGHTVVPDELHERIAPPTHPEDKILICCSKGALGAPWMEGEIDRALAKEEGREGKALLAVDLDGHLSDKRWKNPRADNLRSRLVAQVKGWESGEGLEAEFESLLKLFQRG